MQHHPNQKIEALARAASANLPQLQCALEQGYVPPPEGTLSAPQQAALFRLVQQLCDEGHFLQAAPLALQLAVHHPKDSRYSFIAGRAFQRLAIFNIAAVLYGLSLQQNRTPTSMYRLGECMAGLGQPETAIRFFDGAFDIARGDDSFRHVQDLAMQAIERLRSTT
ncbi:hypothetical protein [Variovorax sp. KK3]|uniref:hypothetical protein n=1 Tax=Variovorax sp. KK3 TaxID=1855728 RepID=UPI00097C645F|nr:hypothetical protein [Variovorax sp. KK3]